MNQMIDEEVANRVDVGASITPLMPAVVCKQRGVLRSRHQRSRHWHLHGILMPRYTG
ncbi:hypothetical protein [Arenicella xantha]|uniref:hypothetical protein n=1 Tax=Arenicella xantha TaxID=644221 RepID=UPI001472B98D|nr:hypothetical protein [Arenicella xantha]